jgi:hypothetical protein
VVNNPISETSKAYGEAHKPTQQPEITLKKNDHEEIDNDDHLDQYVMTISEDNMQDFTHSNCLKIDDSLIPVKTGTTVSLYDFQQLPTPGNIYKVNDNHNLVAIKFIPGEIYQADDQGKLIPIGLFNFKFNA